MLQRTRSSVMLKLIGQLGRVSRLYSHGGGGGGGRQLGRWDTRPRAVKTRMALAVDRRRPDDYKEQDKRRKASRAQRV